MFVDASNTPKPFNPMDITTISQKKPSYSVKKLLKQLIKLMKFQKMTSQPITKCVKKAEVNEAFEFFDDTFMTDVEYDCDSMASFKIDLNESACSGKALSCEMEDFDLSDISNTIPVHYIRNENGSFFWNAANDMPVDNDLVEPLCCSTNNQLACMQDRWTHV